MSRFNLMEAGQSGTYYMRGKQGNRMQPLRGSFNASGNSATKRTVFPAEQRDTGARAPHELTAHEVHEGLKGLRSKIAKTEKQIQPLETKIANILKRQDEGSRPIVKGSPMSRQKAKAELQALRRQAGPLVEQLRQLVNQKQELEQHPNNTAGTTRPQKGPVGAATRTTLRTVNRPKQNHKKDCREQARRFRAGQREVLLSGGIGDPESGLDENRGEMIVAQINNGEIPHATVKPLRLFKTPPDPKKQALKHIFG